MQSLVIKKQPNEYKEFTVNRDHVNKSKETRVITYTPADILMGHLIPIIFQSCQDELEGLNAH